MQDEIWKDVVGYEQFYQVSNKGRVRRKKNGSIAALRTFPNGYKNALLSHDGTRKAGWHSVLVHRMVAMAFIPNPDNLPQINHKDRDKANNCVENLEWCTVQYNNNYLDPASEYAQYLRNLWSYSQVSKNLTDDGPDCTAMMENMIGTLTASKVTAFKRPL